MKRRFALAITLLMLIGLLTACGEHEHTYDNATDYLCNNCEHNRLVGTWTATIEGESGEMTLEEDGTGTIISNGVTRPCTWSIQEDALTVDQTIEGFHYTFIDNGTFALEDNTLTITSQSGNTLVFKKK